MANNTQKTDLDRLDDELEGLLERAIPVKARVAKNAKVVFSLRVSGKELDEFYAAAEARGMTLSDFMRSATRAAIRGDLDVEKAAAVGAVREKVRELAEAVGRL